MNRNRYFFRRARTTLNVCSELDRCGCVIRSAHLHAGAPMICIEKPEKNLFATFSRRTEADGRVTAAVLLKGVRVEWEEGRVAA